MSPNFVKSLKNFVVEWDVSGIFFNEASKTFSEITAFRSKSSWLSPKGHASLEIFFNQLQEELLQMMPMSHPKVICPLSNGKHQQILLQIAVLSSKVQIEAHRWLFGIGQTTYYKLKNILMTNGYRMKLSFMKTFWQIWLKRVIRSLIVCAAIDWCQKVSSSILPTILRKQPTLGSSNFYPKCTKD